MNRAACKREDPELFFPISYTAGFAPQIAQARAVCRPCPVRSECLEGALERAEADGIWAGLTPAERRTLRTETAVTS